MASDADAVFARHQSLYLRAGAGVFAANLIVGKIKEQRSGHLRPMRAHTWLRDDMLLNGEVPLPPAAIPEQSIAALLLRMVRASTNSVDRVVPPRLTADIQAEGPARVNEGSPPQLTPGLAIRLLNYAM